MITTRSDWVVKTISVSLFLALLAVGVLSFWSREMGATWGAFVIIGIAAAGGAVLTRRHLFRVVTFTQEGVAWAGLLERGSIPWAGVREIGIHYPPRFAWVGTQGIEFFRIELRFKGRGRKFIVASYSRTPIRVAAEAVRLCPDSERVAGYLKQIDVV